MNTPDLPEAVPFVPGTVRGKKWQAPPKPEQPKLEEEIELDIDLGEETEIALSAASTDQVRIDRSTNLICLSFNIIVI